ncbi:MAG: hypothetical protein EXS02_08920 [Planctomycetes bacterium]|nr:hypothetical protein [Planctomycetota bacterium]
MTNDLVQLARSLQLDSLEKAWAQATKAPKPDSTRHYLATIDALCERDMQSRAAVLAAQMIDALTTAAAVDSAIELATRVVKRGAHNEALVRNLVSLIERRFATEDWWPLMRERSGLNPASVTAQALLEFDRLRRYTTGHVIYHQAGWGEGVVTAFHADRKEIEVTFATGRREEFPIDTVIARFKPLESDDLRAMKLQQIDELKRLMENEPAILIRIAAKLYRGTISSTQLKAELVPAIVEDKTWASFWKRAKTAATKDAWLKVEGNANRPTFVLRDKPIGLAEEAAVAMTYQNDLGARVERLRDYLARGQDVDVRRQILDLASKTIAQAIEEKKANHAHILDGLLFLAEHGHATPVPPARELRALLVSADGTLQPNAIDRLATQESREHAVKLLPEALGEDWADRCLAILPDFPISVIEPVVMKLIEEKQGARLLDLWDRVAPYPRRHPVLTYLLCRAYADGVFDSRENRPDEVTVGRVLLHLARVLNGDRKGNALYSRLLGRLTSLLSGKRGFLNKPLKAISRDDLASYLGITERAGEDFPQEIVDMVLRCVALRFPELTAKLEKPFWEREDIILTTRAGLKRIKADYDVLVGEKIPANSKAIGAAASLGDLSENSEWESAMEEQRNLTTRATDMDREIRAARLIEDQDIPTDLVAPGNHVILTEVATGTQLSYRLLGPWDMTDESVINYRAPIAKGILGRKVGDTGDLPGLEGPTQVRIEKIERAV